MENKDNVETTNTEKEVGQETQQGEEQTQKTFTQKEVDEIVQKRLAKERKKQEQSLNPQETELDKREKEITQRELKADCKERLASDGYAPELIDLIDTTSKENFEQSYKKVIDIINKAKNYGGIDVNLGCNHDGAVPKLNEKLKNAFDSHK